MKHDHLKQKVMAALDELFSDTSVSQKKTLESLEEVRGEVEMKIEAIKADLG